MLICFQNFTKNGPCFLLSPPSPFLLLFSPCFHFSLAVSSPSAFNVSSQFYFTSFPPPLPSLVLFLLSHFLPSFSNSSIFPLRLSTHSPTPLFFFFFFLLRLYAINFLHSLYFIFFFLANFPLTFPTSFLLLSAFVFTFTYICSLRLLHDFISQSGFSISCPSFFYFFLPTLYCTPLLSLLPSTFIIISVLHLTALQFSFFHHIFIFSPTLTLLSSCSSYAYPTSSLIRLMLYFTFLCAFSPKSVIVLFPLLLPHLFHCLSQLRLSFSSLTLTSVASDRQGHSLTLLPVSGCVQGCRVVCHHL